MGNTIVIAILISIVIIAVVGTVKRVLYGSSCCGKRDRKTKKVRVFDKNKSHYPNTYTLVVDGMHCSNCSRRVENALNSQEGIWATVKLEEKTVLVRAKRVFSKEELSSIIQKAGYSVISFK